MAADKPKELPETPGKPGELIDERLFVGGLAKGLKILDVLGEYRSPMSLTEISKQSGIGRSGAQRIIHTLSALGYIKKDEATRRYLLAPKILGFAGGYLRSGGLAEKAFPYLLEANKLTDETVNLTEMDGTDIIYVARFPSRNIITSDITIGSRLPLFCTAPGQAMLSRMPRDRAMSILQSAPLEPRTPYTVTDIDKIVAKLIAAHDRGYALAEQEAFTGEVSIASAVIDRDGDVVGSVNIAVSLLRWKIADATKGLAPVVMEIAAAISKTLR